MEAAALAPSMRSLICTSPLARSSPPWMTTQGAPRLSAYWIRLVTRTDPHLARELVEGLLSDIVAPDDGFWAVWPRHRRQSFDEATRLALAGEADELSAMAMLVEEVAEWVTPSPTDGAVAVQ